MLSIFSAIDASLGATRPGKRATRDRRRDPVGKPETPDRSTVKAALAGERDPLAHRPGVREPELAAVPEPGVPLGRLRREAGAAPGQLAGKGDAEHAGPAPGTP